MKGRLAGGITLNSASIGDYGFFIASSLVIGVALKQPLCLDVGMCLKRARICLLVVILSISTFFHRASSVTISSLGRVGPPIASIEHKLNRGESHRASLKTPPGDTEGP